MFQVRVRRVESIDAEELRNEEVLFILASLCWEEIDMLQGAIATAAARRQCSAELD